MTFNRGTLVSAILMMVTVLSLILLAPQTIIKATSHLELPEDEDTAAYATYMENATYNIFLLVSDYDGEFFLEGLNISIFDPNNNLVLSGISNDTGCLSVKLGEGFYIIVVKADDRIVGCQEIYVDEPKTAIIRAWAYTLKVTCIDQEENHVEGVIVLLYGSPSAFNETSVNEEWKFKSLARTNKNGTAIFYGVWNGTYKIVVESGRIIGEKILEVDESKHITIKCNETSLKINVVTSTPTEYPLSNASVLLQDSTGRLFLRGYTDDEGFVQFSNVYIDNYTVFIDWLDTEVFSGKIDTGFSRSLKIKASVFEVSLRVTGPFGEPLPYSKIVLSKKISGRPSIDVGELEADKNGFIAFFLPPGTYEFSCMRGIYFGKISVNLYDNYSGVVQCNLHANVWILLLLLSLAPSILSLLLERNKLRRPLEYRRYQNMLSRLESMYSNGLVEYKIYRKLKEEYETKLMELGGRKRR